MKDNRYCWCGKEIENDHPLRKYCDLHCYMGIKYWETVINNRKNIFNQWLKYNGNGKLEFEDVHILERIRIKLKSIKKNNKELYDILIYEMYKEEGENFVKMSTEDMSYFRDKRR